MPAVYDNGGVLTTTTNDLPITCNLTIGAGSDRLLLVALQHQSGGATLGVPTFNGVTMELLDSASAGPSGTFYLYRLVNPPVGTYQLSMLPSVFGFAKVMWGSFRDVPGGNVGTPFEILGTSNAPSSGSQTCPDGALLFGAMVHNYSTAAATLTAGTAIGSNYEGGAGRLYAAAWRSSTGALAWSSSDSNPWAILGVAVLGTGTGATAPTISAQPANQSVTAPNAATFSVTASGTAPLGYQWRKNGVDISGANSAVYNTPPTAFPADNGALFAVVVSNAAGSVTSSNATLVVSAPTDTTPPTLTGSIALSALSSTGVTITSPVATDSGGVAGYQWRIGTSGGWTSIAGGGRSATITGRTPGSTDTIQMRAFDNASPANFSAPLSVDVTYLTAATFGLISESIYFASDTGPQLGRSVSWAIWYGVQPTQAGVAGLPSVTPIVGTGTTRLTDGAVPITGLPAAGQLMLLIVDGDGGVYLQSGTAA